MSVRQLKRVTIQLARGPAHPDGSARFGYDIIAPLTHDGHLDPHLWKENRAACTVRRFRPGEDDRFGMLVHKAGGPDGARWIIDYNTALTEDDELGFRLDRHHFVPGEYVTFSGENETHAYKVVDVHAF
jgi:hypothetical protein